MYSVHRTASSKPISSASFDEHLWVSQIRRTLEEELEDDDEVPVSIFNVPKVLMAANPDSYTPQEVAIGPYHYRRPDLYEMERYKLSAAKRTRNNFHDCKFHDIVKQLTNHEARIRASYHKYLPLSGETLAWMMSIDAAFLLEFLRVYAVKQGKCNKLARLSSRMSHLFDYTGQKAAHNALIRDIVMLENQIPLFVLRKMMEFQFSTLEEADDMLSSMLLGFCKEISPFRMTENALLLSEMSDCAHLLDFLYNLVTPKFAGARREEIIDIMVEMQETQGKEQGAGEGREERSLGQSNLLKRALLILWKVLRRIWKFLKKVNCYTTVVKLINKLLQVFKPLIGFFLKLPLKILSNIPGLKFLATPIEIIVDSQNQEETKPEDDCSNSKANKPPLIEEITIPSVMDLTKSGVLFRATKGNISTIAFDGKTMTFYLPEISLNVNTGAVLRNLVAYEASYASGPMVFTRYTELINGIIDTEDDVRLLREKGIILSSLSSDEEVANLCNGMCKSIRLTRVPLLDKVIEDVNKYYEGRWKVKYGKFMKSYVFGSWKLLTLLATVLMLLFMALQSFCSVYTCSRILDDVTK